MKTFNRKIANFNEIYFLIFLFLLFTSIIYCSLFVSEFFLIAILPFIIIFFLFISIRLERAEMITKIQYHSDRKQFVFVQKNQNEISIDKETLLYDNRGYNHILVYNASNDFELEISRPEWKEDIVSFFKESDLKCQKYEKKVSHFESIVDFLGSWS